MAEHGSDPNDPNWTPGTALDLYDDPAPRRAVEAAIVKLERAGVKRIAGYTIEALRRRIAVDESAREAPMLLVLRAALIK